MTADREALRRELAEALLKRATYTRDWAGLVADDLLPLVERAVAAARAEALNEAYWATAAITDAEGVRDVLRARAAALAGTSETTEDQP